MVNIDETFIDSLIQKMTLREKIGQLNQPETPFNADVEKFREMVRKGEVGSILMSVGATAGNDEQGAIDISFYNEIQRIAVEESPNGIPVLFGRDVIHGHRTVFPIPLAMAASFNPELIEQYFRITALEASADGIHWTFTPMLDLSRDPRWGRIIEGPGEDPFVGACMARAAVKGLQGDDPSEKGRILACAKHYIGYGASEGGRDYHRTEISDYSLYNYYLPAFKAAVESGVLTVMSSFNDINGQPVTSSRHYLTEILRDKLGFEGFVVSDYDAVIQLMRQGVAGSGAEAAELAVIAGVDMDMHDHCYLNHLESLVESGRIPVSVIDTAVRRILRVKFAKGLFENPYCIPASYDRTLHLKYARKMAVESMVLLKNENNLLPLDKSANIALVGPFATERRSLLGSWVIDGKAEETPNLLESIKKVVTGRVNYSSGVGLNWDGTLNAMKNSDVVILALGESWTATGESRAVSNISIPDEQIALIRKARASGKKVVGVLFCGRPIAMEGIADNFDALLYAWHSGSETAGAVCDILFGDAVPSGKLPVTIPRLATHIPLYYNVTSSGRPVNCYYDENPGACYVDSYPTPYYPFGYGLSFTEFEYGKIECENLQIPLQDIENGKRFKFTIEVKNTGNFDGMETVQLYIRDRVAKMMRPIRELKAFRKVFIKQGGSAVVEFELGYGELGYYMPDGEYIVDKGDIEVYIGENCLTENSVIISIV